MEAEEEVEDELKEEGLDEEEAEAREEDELVPPADELED